MPNEHTQDDQEQQPVAGPVTQAEQQTARQMARPPMTDGKQGRAAQPALTLSRPAIPAGKGKGKKTGAVPIGTSGTLFVVHN